MIMTICLSATIQKTVTFKKFTLSEVNRSIDYRFDASGKAVNTARVLNQLEPSSTISILPLGQENASLFKMLAERDGLELKNVLIPGFTRECITAIDSDKHTTTEIVVDEPSMSFDREKFESEFIKLIENNLTNVKGVIIAGSSPKYFSSELQSKICRLIKTKGIKLLVDYHGESLLNTLKHCSPDFVKINADEYSATFSLPKHISEEEFKASMNEQSMRYKNIFIVTRGTESTLACNNGDFFECETTKIEPINTTACGDSFNAGFFYEYLSSSDIRKSLQKGTECATKNALSLIPGSLV